MIQAKHISKTYGTTNVLKDVSFSLAPTEIVSIIGPSGAGKTTLLHILGTLEHADVQSQTELIINGKAVNRLSDKALSAFRNESLGFVFQFHQLLPEFTAMENICMPAFIRGTSKREAEKKAMELLDFFELTNRAKHKPSELSGGEQQRISVARALINKPSLLLADEPSGNLDSVSADKLHDMFFRLRDTFSISMILVTHNKSLATRADRMLNLVDGQWN
ncbi:MAG: ABC transporter ATP-binding protein [Flavobacteriales bacterium]|nr:MAG: ABC transporter ATP-binding protein [Flavobacteriales bacterium]RPF73465.1 MAG: ABC transporter ATP-binding protein [Thiotrichales bacterium TMED285]